MPNDTAELRLAAWEAEEKLLGAILLGSSNYDGLNRGRRIINSVRRMVSSEDFHAQSKWGDTRNRRIYEAMLSTTLPPTVTNVERELARNHQLQKDDCLSLEQFFDTCPTYVDWPYYAGAVVDYAKRRNPNRKPPVSQGGIPL